MFDRRQILGGLTLGAAAIVSCPAHASDRPALGGPRFAVTVDDFRFEDGPQQNGASRHRAILDALGAAGIQAAGLITGKHVDNPEAGGHLAAWSEAGHAIGNHT